MALTSLLTADAPSIRATFGPPQWGIFGSGGTPILVADSVNTVQYTRDYQISDYPQEQGAFQSYNKVKVPFQAKVSFLIGAARQGFLNSVERAVASLELVTVVTPEVRYSSANLLHYDYRRTAKNGKTLIVVEVWCQEVRIVAGVSQPTAANPSGTNTSDINGAATSQAGNLQAESATASPTGNYAESEVFNESSGEPGPGGGNSRAVVTIQGVTSTSLDEAGQPIPDSTNTWSALTPEQQAGTVQYGTEALQNSDGQGTMVVSPPNPVTGNTTIIVVPAPPPLPPIPLNPPT